MDRTIFESLGIPLVDKDPLEPNVTLIGKYYTHHFIKKISLPNGEYELIEIFKNDKYIVLSDLRKMFTHSNNMKGVLKDHGRSVIKEYLKGNRNFDWSECLLNYTLEKRYWPKDWSRSEKIDWIKASDHDISHDTERLRSAFIEKLCLSGDLVLYDIAANSYVTEIEYYGSGFYIENELCGNSGVHFCFKGVELCYHVTWVS